MLRIGVGFDNTLVCYDQLFLSLAREAKLSPPDALAGKDALRDWLLQRPQGELSWRRLQAQAWGPNIARAKLFDGVRAVLEQCRQHGARVFVVSHKTRFAPQDRDGINLHEAARGFLRLNGLFRDGLLAKEDVYFEDNRIAKVARIARLGCDLFFDDLPQVFAENSFPAATRPVLFSRQPAVAGIPTCGSWPEFGEFLERECQWA